MKVPFSRVLFHPRTCHHHHWAVVVHRGWAKASARRLQVSLFCPLPDRVPPVFVQVVSRTLDWSHLSNLLVIWYQNGGMRDPSAGARSTTTGQIFHQFRVEHYTNSRAGSDARPPTSSDTRGTFIGETFLSEEHADCLPQTMSTRQD